MQIEQKAEFVTVNPDIVNSVPVTAIQFKKNICHPDSRYWLLAAQVLIKVLSCRWVGTWYMGGVMFLYYEFAQRETVAG